MDIRKLGVELPNLFENQEVPEGAAGAGQTGAAAAAEMGAVDSIEAGLPAVNVGTTASALTGPTEVRVPGEEKIPEGSEFEQKEQMACGTTSLSYILKMYGINLSPDQIDDVIRRTDNGAVPLDLMEFARDQGLEAECYNNSTIEELKSFIDKGIPCQVLIDPRDTNELAKQHYVDVVGYGKNPDGSEYIIYQDPADGLEHTMPMEEFERKWSDLWGGFNNFFIAYAPGGTELPPSREDGIDSLLYLAEAGMNITNGWDRMASADNVGEFTHGLFQLPGGIVQGIGTGIGFGIQYAGNWLNDQVEGIPVLENIVQPFGDVLDTVGSVFGHVFGGIGEAFDDVGGAFESLFNGDFGGFASGIGEAVTDVVGGVVDAVGDVVEGIGDAVSDFFSGW